MTVSESKQGQSLAPFFTIGVTTYNRRHLLKQTLRSIIAQTFTDFEVIVGNDYVQEPLSQEMFSFDDDRIRFVNHSQNLGEVENNNTLLMLARGRYFTWQTDDDLYSPKFLEEVHRAIHKYHWPQCVFTSFQFIHGTVFPDPVKAERGHVLSLSGKEFLRMYWSDEIKALGCNGVYERNYLTSLGGVETLSDTTFALYSEHLLLLKTGLLDRVVYINWPLVQFRNHEGSWGSTRKDPLLSMQAGENFIAASLTILRHQRLRQDFRQNIASVLFLVVKDVLSRFARAHGRSASLPEFVSYLLKLKARCHALKPSALYWKALYSLVWVGLWLIWKGRITISMKAMLLPKCHRFVNGMRLPFGRRR